MKEEILNIFLELLKEWEEAECVCINEYGCTEDYDKIEPRKQEYIERFNKVLNV